jgi:hypothetical protein
VFDFVQPVASARADGSLAAGFVARKRARRARKRRSTPPREPHDRGLAQLALAGHIVGPSLHHRSPAFDHGIALVPPLDVVDRR